METKIQKWGNSLGVRLPKSIAKSKSFKEGSRVVVTESATGIAIEICVPKLSLDLDTLLAGITTTNQHKKVDWGAPVGNEVW
jgi:antitoxin MazE